MSKFILFSILSLTMVFGFLTLTYSAYGQNKDFTVTCPSCVNIPPEEIDLYKKLFPLIIWADDTVYDHKSIIVINGYLQPENTFFPITMTVTNPIGNIVTVDQLTPNSSGEFTKTFNTGSTLWQKDGTYIIKAQSGPENRSFKIQVELISTDKGTKFTCMTNEIVVRSDNGGKYCIPFKVKSGHTTGVEGFLKINSKSLEIDVRDTDFNSLTLTLPRFLLDSKNPDGSDSEFVILLKGAPAQFSEKLTTDDSRTLEIQYTSDRKGKIEIIGTSVVPEFGTQVMFALFLPLIALILVLKRQTFFQIMNHDGVI